MRRTRRLVIAGLVASSRLAIGASTLLAQSPTTSAITPTPRSRPAQVNAYAGKTGSRTAATWKRPLLDAQPDHQGQRRDADPGVVDRPRHLPEPRSLVRLRGGVAGRVRAGRCTSRRRSTASTRWTRRPVRSSGTSIRPTQRGIPDSRSARAAVSRASRSATGLVFVGLADGSLVALNQMSGQVAWRTIAGSWQQGERLSAAPHYYNGIIFEPIASGDGGGISTTVEAFNATNGTLLWSWGVVPQAGQPGSNTWSFAGRRDGQPLRRWGDLADAVDRRQGQHADRRHRQSRAVELPRSGHEPLHGFDRRSEPLHRPAQVVLPDGPPRRVGLGPAEQHDRLRTKYKGKKIKAVADVAKYGWTWLLNAKTGKPIEKVDQVKVPTSTRGRRELLANRSRSRRPPTRSSSRR